MSYDREKARDIWPTVSFILTAFLGVLRSKSYVNLNITIGAGIAIMLAGIVSEIIFLNVYPYPFYELRNVLDNYYLLFMPMGILILFVSLFGIQDWLSFIAALGMGIRYLNREYHIIPRFFEMPFWSF